MELQSYASLTHQGPYLQLNEDGQDFDLENGLFMLFDGFGGAGCGDRAVNLLKEAIKSFYTRFSVDPEATMPFYYSPRYLLEGNAMINAMMLGHKALCKHNTALEMSQRGGSSAILVSLSENLLTLAQVGNVAAYVFRNGRLEKLLMPDDFRFIGKDDYSRHLRTVPMSAFGLFDNLHYQIKEVRPLKGDEYLFLTDGVWARLQDKEMAHIMNERVENLDKKIDMLFELSNSRGNWDNQSGMILKF